MVIIKIFNKGVFMLLTFVYSLYMFMAITSASVIVIITVSNWDTNKD
jgi:hypothetical protein